MDRMREAPATHQRVGMPCGSARDRSSKLVRREAGLLKLASMADVVAWILLGWFAGLIARILIRGGRKTGFLGTTVLGIAGAMLGGWVGRHTGFLPAADPGVWLPTAKSLITASVGAWTLLAIGKALRK